MTDVIRYGAGGKPYKGVVGDQSTEASSAPAEEPVEEPKVEVVFTEDDTPLSDE